MVFCFENCSHLFMKKCSNDQENLFANLRLKTKNLNSFYITGTIYSKSERSEHFLKQSAFSTCSWRFLRSDRNITFRIQIGTNNWEVETYRNKLENVSNKVYFLSSRLSQTHHIIWRKSNIWTEKNQLDWRSCWCSFVYLW